MQLFLSNVLTAFTQVVILFLVAMVGLVCHKTGIYTEKASRLTTDLLFYIVAPAIIIRSFLGMEFSRDTLGGLLKALLGGIFFHLVGMIFTKILFNKSDKDTACIFKYACCYGNVGYMALPLAQAVLGDEGVFYCSAGVVAFNILSFTHGIWHMTKGEGKNKFNPKLLILNPGVISVLIGLPLFIFDVQLPDMLNSAITHISNLNTPLAMLFLGTYIANTDIKSMFKEKNNYLVILLKTIALPLIMFVIFKLVGISGALLTACMISASVPSANNTVMFSAKYGKDTGVASKVVSLCSLVSIFTMPIMIALSKM